MNTSNTSLDYIRHDTAASPTHCVIWLHGLGADGHDFAQLLPQLDVHHCAIRFIFPHAPKRPITINGGMHMPGWYDIVDFGMDTPEDEAGILTSVAQLQALIAEQVSNGIVRENILLAGFSQGGAIALYAGLTDTMPLGGILALSTYLPLRSHFPAKLSPQTEHMPIFMAHGTYDQIVHIQHGQASTNFLLKADVPVEFKAYPMAHELCANEIHDISEWLKARVDF